MKKTPIKIVVIGAVLALFAMAFVTGRVIGIRSTSDLQSKRELELQDKLFELDQAFLKDVVTRPNTMTSGRYTLEIKLAGQMKKISVVELEFAKGKLVKLSKLPIENIENIVQTGNVVSWTQYDMDKGPIARFVGLIDGNVMWGRVYVGPGSGWRDDERPAHGVWRLYPATQGPLQQTRESGEHEDRVR